MAKSKNGGTRAMIRGRVGADVYSIGKDGKGVKQQVVRSLAETVANPQTTAQMRGRMIMSTVMQAVSALSVLVDHSFDGYPAGQPSISEFIRRNYKLIKDDVAANPASGNAFGIVKYQEKGAKNGAYVVASGKQLIPSAAVNSATGLVITASGDSLTIAAVRSALGLGSEEFLTLMGLATDGTLEFTRIHLSDSLADSTVITSDNVNEALDLESVGTPEVVINGMTITISLAGAQANSALIISKKVNGAFEHNTAVLLTPSAPEFTADVALATYPVGEEMILNGGNFNGGGSVTPVTPTYNPTIQGVTVNGSAVSQGATAVAVANGNVISMTATSLDPSKTYQLQGNVSDVAGSTNAAPGEYRGSFSDGQASVTFDSDWGSSALYWMLVEFDGSTPTKIATWFSSASV